MYAINLYSSETTPNPESFFKNIVSWPTTQQVQQNQDKYIDSNEFKKSYIALYRTSIFKQPKKKNSDIFWQS